MAEPDGLALIVEQVCDGEVMTSLTHPARIRETATFVARIETGWQPRYLLLVGELHGGHGYIYAMQLPWGGSETERWYDNLASACANAAEIYQMWTADGVWQIRRSPANY